MEISSNLNVKGQVCTAGVVGYSWQAEITSAEFVKRCVVWR